MRIPIIILVKGKEVINQGSGLSTQMQLSSSGFQNGGGMGPRVHSDAYREDRDL